MSIRVTGIGTLTRDAEVKETGKGAWVKFGLATERKNVPENMQDVDFFEANYYLKNPASTLPSYLKKGTTIYVDNAEMRADQYEKDGQKRTMNKIMIFSFDLIKSPAKKENTVPEAPIEAAVKTEEPAKIAETPKAPTQDNTFTDDLPF